MIRNRQFAAVGTLGRPPFITQRQHEQAIPSTCTNTFSSLHGSVHMYMYIYVYTHSCMIICVDTHTYTYMHIRPCVFTYIHTPLLMYLLCIYIYIYPCVYMYICIYIYTREYVYIYIYVEVGLYKLSTRYSEPPQRGRGTRGAADRELRELVRLGRRASLEAAMELPKP